MANVLTVVSTLEFKWGGGGGGYKENCDLLKCKQILKEENMFFILVNFKTHFFFFFRERGGVVVEHWTPNREVLGSNPKGVTALCP